MGFSRLANLKKVLCCKCRSTDYPGDKIPRVLKGRTDSVVHTL
jgi:hypothetical protein